MAVRLAAPHATPACFRERAPAHVFPFGALECAQPGACAGRRMTMSTSVGATPKTTHPGHGAAKRPEAPRTTDCFRERLRGAMGLAARASVETAPRAPLLAQPAQPQCCAADRMVSANTRKKPGENIEDEDAPVVAEQAGAERGCKRDVASDDQHDDVRMNALSRHLAAEQPRALAMREVSLDATQVCAGADVQQMAAKLLEMFAIGTHLGRPMARMVMSTGRLAGAELTLTQHGKRVALQIEGASPEAELELRDRVGQSLAAKGIGVD
jgi:hypothetical protein